MGLVSVDPLEVFPRNSVPHGGDGGGGGSRACSPLSISEVKAKAATAAAAAPDSCQPAEGGATEEKEAGAESRSPAPRPTPPGGARRGGRSPRRVFLRVPVPCGLSCQVPVPEPGEKVKKVLSYRLRFNASGEGRSSITRILGH